MSDIKSFTSSVALLADIVGSRTVDRAKAHAELLHAIRLTNDNVAQLDPLRVTVGDELQGVYPTMGQAFRAIFSLRAHSSVELRFGLGGGTVRIIDGPRGIQDGSAWVRARGAIERAEWLAAQPGYRGVRTAIDDARTVANPLVGPLSQLADAQLARLSPGATESLYGLLAGESNADVARRLGISPSANSQRVATNALRPLAAAIESLFLLG